MSYILEALKKSDQQRQRGATPTLQVAQVTVAAPRRPMFIYYGLLAAVLLGAGITIGWLRPWQPEQPLAATTLLGTEPVAAPAPLTTPPETLSKTAQEFPAPKLTQAGQAVPVAGAMKPGNAALVSSVPSAAAPIADKSMPGKSASNAGDAQEQKTIPMNELPPQIQQEIPAMTVQLHSYSGKPSERLVYINSTRLREGESLMPGLTLEQITPDGMIFSYKGYRFQHGIR